MADPSLHLDDAERTLLGLLLLVLLPPIGAYAAVGLTAHFWLNVVLTLLGYLPGLIHAIWLLLRD